MIRLDRVTLGYGVRELLSDVTATIPAGSLTALIGRNGAGKSTFMRAVIGLESPLKGAIEICGESISQLDNLARAKMVSLVTTERVRIANLSCEALVALGRAPYTNWVGSMGSEDRDIVAESLERVGIAHFAKRSCDRLSDGELQRVMIARALAQQTPIIMLDEPTAFLDMPSRYQLVELLAGLAHSEGKCVVFSTHELSLAMECSDYIALIDSPKMHLLSSSEVISSTIIEDIFGIEARWRPRSL